MSDDENNRGAGSQGEDLEALKLIGHSYDSLFSIRKRIRKINDLTIPLRQGLTTSQIGTGLAVFVVQIILFGMLIRPIFDLFGASVPWQLLVLWLFGPPILAAQNIVKPMPYGKSIPGTVHSIVRSWLDDPIHRRGLPIATPKQPYETKVAHYQREWVPFEEFVADEAGEAPITDRATEKRISFCNRSLGDEEIDFQEWWDNKAKEHLDLEHEANMAIEQDSEDNIGARRGTAASVTIPDTPPRQGTGK